MIKFFTFHGEFYILNGIKYFYHGIVHGFHIYSLNPEIK